MTNLYEPGLWSLYPPLPSLYSNPWRGQVFPLILFTSLSLSTLSHQGHSSSPHHLPPPTTTRSLRWRIIMCGYRPPAPTPPPPGLHFYSSPALQPSVPHQWLDTSTLTQTPQEPPGDDWHICAVVFGYAPPLNHSNVQSGFLPPECLVHRCSVGPGLPVWTQPERVFLTHSYTLQPSFERSTRTKQSHSILPACLRCAGYITAKVFFTHHCTPESRTVIVRAVNSRFVDEKPQLQRSGAESLKKTFFRGTKKKSNK